MCVFGKQKEVEKKAGDRQTDKENSNYCLIFVYKNTCNYA